MASKPITPECLGLHLREKDLHALGRAKIRPVRTASGSGYSVLSTKQLDQELACGSTTNSERSTTIGQRPFRILRLPPELQVLTMKGMHRTFLRQESAIRLRPFPCLAQGLSTSRQFFFDNNVICSSSQPVDLYQKRCRRSVLKFDSEVSEEMTALLDHIGHKDVKDIRKIVFLRSEHHCMPHSCRYWMTVLHIKNGLLSDVGFEEEQELELLPNGGLTDSIPVSFMA
ncbi:hypothetical protein DOTSEDRAFT_35101 [Dothistroma septosporum NZE10]|uniref:Uncharacterized protein n=1 Tax=Dothistroma septosporum (strain NZE10 / CBS 128990) TaxID=675120 RepID=N1PMU9_DOTSN|nr:hypothetical protein DOTSEDRAFT_35101 [Dothistroma septosporum NZE10]